MANKMLLAAAVVLTVQSGVLLGDHSFSSSTSEAPSSSDLYTESPCELRSLSAWKDVQDNIWALGEGNLWWFNATNLSWSLLPLPNGTLTSDSWKVTCGNPKKYVALQGYSGTLVLHLPWQHWQQVDTDDVSGGNVDANASWCSAGVLYAADPVREVLYRLDHDEARWVVQSALSEIDDSNSTKITGMVKTWLGPEEQFILLEKQDSCSHVVETDSSGIPWVVLAKDTDHALWPNTDAKDNKVVLTWRQGIDKLWLWQEERSSGEMWSFNLNTTVWERVNQGFVSRLPSLNSVLATWMEEDRFCVLERSSQCTALYSVSHTRCWSEDDIKSAAEAQPLTTTVTTAVATKPITEKSTPTSRVIVPPSTTSEAKSLNKAQEPGTTMTKPVITKLTTQNDWRASERASDVISIIPARNSPWHQHTSVFGSVIFFGTSLTIFGIVGFFWCVRRCVHFPKEALLLRDPPSVRYTAIPDSLNYDSRRPTPATYTVIPDSIA